MLFCSYQSNRFPPWIIYYRTWIRNLKIKYLNLDSESLPTVEIKLRRHFRDGFSVPFRSDMAKRKVSNFSFTQVIFIFNYRFPKSLIYVLITERSESLFGSESNMHETRVHFRVKENMMRQPSGSRGATTVLRFMIFRLCIRTYRVLKSS